MKSFFINEALDKAINDYLQSQNRKESILFNSFLVVVIRALINIYDENDILEPYKCQNKEEFINNLLKYGAKKESIDNLMRLLDGFYLIDQRNAKAVRREENVYFIEVQKRLIDLFNLKRLSYGTTLSETQEFYNLLYTPMTKNPLRLSFNYLNAPDIFEIANYYQTSLTNNDYKNEEITNLEIAINEKLSNKSIYHSYDIKEKNIEQKEEIELDLKDALTTGNGYVDILIIMSIIITVVMVVVIFTTLVF